MAEASDVLDGLPLVQHAVDLDALRRQEQDLGGRVPVITKNIGWVSA